MLVVKNPPINVGDVKDVNSIPGLGRSPGRGNGNQLQYSCLENPMDKEAWGATVRRVTKSRKRLKQLGTHTQCKRTPLGLKKQCTYYENWQNRDPLQHGVQLKEKLEVESKLHRTETKSKEREDPHESMREEQGQKNIRIAFPYL